MTNKILPVAALAALFASGYQASARAPAPLVPIALVEDVNSKSADVEFMDYVGSGQVIKLGAGESLVLSYLRSCAHETITGGTVTVGTEKSEVQGGKVVRTKVGCNGGKMQLASAQANASAASAFRLQSADIQPILYAGPPMVQIPRLDPKESRVLVIERTDRIGDRIEVDLSQETGTYFDLAKTNAKPLVRGGVYTATLGSKKVMFKMDAKAKIANADTGKKAGKTKVEKPSVLSRLLRFPPG